MPIFALVRPFLRNWPWVALAVSALMLALVHAVETFGGLRPCELCLRQREVYWVAMGAAATVIALRMTPLNPGRWVNTAFGLIFLVGAGIAAYHAGVEYKWWPGPASCTGGHTVSAADLAGFLGGAKATPPQCDKAAWVFLGISMAGYNALLSLKLTLLSFWAAFGPVREPGAA